MQRRTFIASFIAMVAASRQALAAFPDRTINLIIPYSAGGGTDRTARLLVPFLESNLGAGATIVPVNRPGAGGAIGWTELAAAEPDGFTIGLVNFPDVVTAPITSDVKFGPDSFTYLGTINREPTTLSVPEKSRFTSLKQLIDEATSKPGTITAATPGLRNVHNIGLSVLKAETGADLISIPFDGGGAARSAVLGGHVDVAALSMGAVLGREGMRILGQMAGDQVTTNTGIPSFNDAISVPIENFVIRSFAMPSGVPDDMRQTLALAFQTVMQDPNLADEAMSQGIDLTYLSGDELAEISKRLDTTLRALWESNPWMEI